MDARSWRVQHKLRLVGQALTGEARLVDVNLIDRSNEVEIVLMRKAGQVATPISQLWTRNTISELARVSGNLVDSDINGPEDSECEVTPGSRYAPQQPSRPWSRMQHRNSPDLFPADHLLVCR